MLYLCIASQLTDGHKMKGSDREVGILLFCNLQIAPCQLLLFFYRIPTTSNKYKQ